MKRRTYVEDWIPARRVADDRGVVNTGPSLMSPGSRGFRGVGLAPIVALSGAAAAKFAASGQKGRVAPMVIPIVRNGPLSQRAGQTITNSQKGLSSMGVSGVRAYLVNGIRGGGIRGSSSQALWDQTFKAQLAAIIQSVTQTQPILDSINASQAGVSTQITALEQALSAIGGQIPGPVQAAADQCVTDQTNLQNLITTLQSTIDQMNAASAGAANLGFSPQMGSAPVQAIKAALAFIGWNGNALDGTGGTLGKQAKTVQTAANALVQEVNAATTTVNNYINQLNAQATALTAQQQQQATTDNIAQQLVTAQTTAQTTQATTTQQQNLAFAQSTVTSAINSAAQLQATAPASALALLQSSYLQQQAAVDTTGGLTGALTAAIASAQAAVAAQQTAAATAQSNALALQQAQATQYQPPQYPPYQPQPMPTMQYPGGAQYAPQYTPQYAPPPPSYAPQPQYAPQQSQPQYQTDGQGNVYDAFGNYIQGYQADASGNIYDQNGNLVQQAPQGGQGYNAGQPQYNPQQYGQPQYSGDDGGFGAADPSQYGAQVFGLRGMRGLRGARGFRGGARGVGFAAVATPLPMPTAAAPASAPNFTPVSTPTASGPGSAVAQQQAYQILANANQTIAAARTQIQNQQAAAAKSAAAPAPTPTSASWWANLGTGKQALVVLGVAGAGFELVKNVFEARKAVKES